MGSNGIKHNGRSIGQIHSGVVEVSPDITDEDLDFLIQEYGLKPYSYKLDCDRFTAANPNLKPISMLGNPLVYTNGYYLQPGYISGVYCHGVLTDEWYKCRMVETQSTTYDIDKEIINMFQGEILIFEVGNPTNRYVVVDGEYVPITYTDVMALRRKVFIDSVTQPTKGSHTAAAAAAAR